MRPDGSDLQLLYGARSHATGTDGEDVHFLDPRPMANGKLLVRVQPFEAPDLGSQLLEVDTANFVEITQPTLPNRGVLTGPAQVAATTNDVRTVAGPFPRRPLQRGVPVAGRHGPHPAHLDPVPVAGDRDGIHHGTDRAVHGGPPGGRRNRHCRAAVWRVDLRPVAAGRSSPFRARWKARCSPTSSRCSRAPCRRSCSTRWRASTSMPISKPRASACSTCAASTTSPAPTRHRAALRCCAILRSRRPQRDPHASCASRRRSAFRTTTCAISTAAPSASPRAFGMREILGYAPVEPDGSVRIKVPGGRRIRRLGARRERTPHRRPAQQLAASARRAGTQVQWLPRGDARGFARPRQPVRRSQRRRAGYGRAVPEHQPGVLRRLRRDDGAGPRAHQLPDRLRGPAAEHVASASPMSGPTRSRPVARPIRVLPTTTPT